MFLDVARWLLAKESGEDRVEAFQIAPVHDHRAGDALPRFLPFGNHFVRQAEGLGDRSPARFCLLQCLEDPVVFLIELIEGMVLVLFRVTLPSAGRGKLAKTISLYLEDEEPVHRVEDQKVALAADALVVHVVKAPAYRPAFAEATELVRHLDLGVVAFLGGTVVEPAGHGGGWHLSGSSASLSDGA